MPSESSSDRSARTGRGLLPTRAGLGFQLLGLVFAFFGFQILAYGVESTIPVTILTHVGLGGVVLYGSFRTARVRALPALLGLVALTALAVLTTPSI